jgi:hypothetical protein
MLPFGRLNVWPGSDKACDMPALNWSAAHELRNAGFVSFPANGQSAASITQAGRDDLRSREEL